LLTRTNFTLFQRDSKKFSHATRLIRRWSFLSSVTEVIAEVTDVRTCSERASERLQLRANVWKEISEPFLTAHERFELTQDEDKQKK